MISAQQNDRMTRTGPEAPAGLLLRRHWQPAALVEELGGERPIKPVRLLSQDLVLFRDETGALGLIDRDCPHRGADLAFGRLENGGLRCLFHGWLFDVQGRCLETPAEPEGSRICERIQQRSYPVIERSGIIFAYLGDGDPPAFPDLDCFIAPASHVFAFKGHMACNWLQALEVGLDPAHASFLHRFFDDSSPDEAYGRQFRANSVGADMPMTQVLRDYPRPVIEVEPNEIGLRIVALRTLNDHLTHVRVTNLLFPQAFVIPMSEQMTITQWHVPINDVSCYWYAIFTSFSAPIDHVEMRRQRLELYALPDYKPKVGRFNDYGFDSAEQRSRTYTGMGEDINVHDQWAVESQGPIQDRTREHLGQTDKAIIAYRRLLNAAITAAMSQEPGFMELDPETAPSVTGPSTIDAITRTPSWDEEWRALDAKRREQAPWVKPKAVDA
jgi:nitrite reductase/ring-hydroxylating ferredoxin subunit